MANVEITLSQNSADSRIVIDGHDVTSCVASVRVSRCGGNLPTADIELTPFVATKANVETYCLLAHHADVKLGMPRIVAIAKNGTRENVDDFYWFEENQVSSLTDDDNAFGYTFEVWIGDELMWRTPAQDNE